MAVQLNVAQFGQRVSSLLNTWNNATKRDGAESLADVDGFLHVYGERTSDDEQVKKGTAFQTWLLGFEFPSTATLVTKDKIYFLTSQTKAKYLQQLQSGSPPIAVEILALAKAKEPPNDALQKLATAFSELKRVGHIPKDVASGKFADDWNKAVETLSEKPELVDVTVAISTVLAVKDEDELKLVRTAANLTSTVMMHHITNRLELILDKETRISHAAFAEQIEGRLGGGDGENSRGPDMKVWSKGRGLGEVDYNSAEFIYTPIIQSRSTANGFDLRSSAESTPDMLAHKGVVLISVGMKYKGYCANLGRTFIVDPTKEQERVYQLLISLQTELLAKMADGVPAKDVYNHALTYIRDKNPDLEKHFVKNIGFGMGIEFRDGSFLLSGKSNRLLSTGMVFNLVLGFQDMEGSDGKKYALHLIDTVKVNKDKAVCLTEGTKAAKDVFFYLTQDVEETKSRPDKKRPSTSGTNGVPLDNKVAGSKVLRTKTRSAAQPDVAATSAARIQEHQRQLHQDLQENGLKRFADGGKGSSSNETKGWKRFLSYKGEGGLPKEAELLRIFIDTRNLTVILPIYGFATPFHINAIKNVSKNDEGEYTTLRVNFNSPGQVAGRKDDTPFEDTDATFLRSITFRSTDNGRFDHLAKQITDLKKEANKREQQKKEMADVVEQDNLIEAKASRKFKLPEVFVRPALDGKRQTGELEIHENGLRYLGGNSQKIDILFSNMKHLFFQPCDHELIVLIHIHLKSPIMIGKKKAKDIQFYREASDMQFDETGNRKRKFRYGDEDELELEQQERKRRQALNREFKNFAEKIGESSTKAGDELEAEIPFSDLGFEGVPSRAAVKLYPTFNCLVQLSDPPFLVVTLQDIEIVVLERVQFGLKQFDMVLVFNDYQRQPLQINSIPVSQLDAVKEWLDSVEIPLAESGVNLNWSQIMKTVNEHPLDFFQDGGWSFLTPSGGGAADEKSMSEDSETESEFEAEGEDFEESSSSDAESAFDGSNASEDDSGSDFGDGSDGEDWDELERKAAKSDKKRLEASANGKSKDDDSDSDRPKKKAPPKKNGASAKGKAPPPKGKR